MQTGAVVVLSVVVRSPPGETGVNGRLVVRQRGKAAHGGVVGCQFDRRARWGLGDYRVVGKPRTRDSSGNISG